MDLVTPIKSSAPSSSDLELTPEVRRKIGARLRGLRAEEHLRIEDVARETRMAPNTVLAIEHALYNVRRRKLEDVAIFFHTTLAMLVAASDTPPPAADPRLDELNSEHLAIAIRYRNARNAVRATVERLLDDPGSEDAFVDLLGRLLHLPCTRVRDVETFVTLCTDDDPEVLDLFWRVRHRMVHDAAFTKVFTDFLSHEERKHPLPQRRRGSVDSAPRRA